MSETKLGLMIERGTCHCLFAFDVAALIDLEQAQKLVQKSAPDPTTREQLHHRRSAPQYFEFKPPPLRVSQQGTAHQLGAFATHPAVDCMIYDFGAIGVSYSIDLAGPVLNLARLSETLYGNAALLADARRHVETLLQRIEPAVSKMNIAPPTEDYVIYQIETLSPSLNVEQFVTDHAQTLAQILRSEGKTLSNQEVHDALSCRISYRPDDLTLIDWQAALLLGRDVDDVRAVLEFANVELLELRYLDDQLDVVLDTFYKALSRRRWRFSLKFQAGTAELRRLARLQMESATLFEEVNHALKLLGDQFLARVYRLASQRMHINDWDASILRKLQTVESLYSKLSDFQNTRRMELLEWIIILLIAISILIAFVPGLLH